MRWFKGPANVNFRALPCRKSFGALVFFDSVNKDLEGCGLVFMVGTSSCIFEVIFWGADIARSTTLGPFQALDRRSGIQFCEQPRFLMTFKRFAVVQSEH